MRPIEKIKSVQFDAERSVLIVDTGRCNLSIIALEGTSAESFADHLQGLAEVLRKSCRRGPIYAINEAPSDSAGVVHED